MLEKKNIYNFDNYNCEEDMIKRIIDVCYFDILQIK